MSLLVRAIPWVVLIGLAYFAGCHYAQDRTLKAGIEVLADRVDSLKGEAGKVDTVYRTDTLNLTRVRRVTDSVLLTDSLFLRDTVYLRPRVMGLVESERAACTDALRTCEQRVAQRDTIIAGLDSIVKLQKKRQGSDWKTKMGYLLGGAAIGVLIPR